MCCTSNVHLDIFLILASLLKQVHEWHCVFLSSSLFFLLSWWPTIWSGPFQVEAVVCDDDCWVRWFGRCDGGSGDGGSGSLRGFCLCCSLMSSLSNGLPYLVLLMSVSTMFPQGWDCVPLEERSLVLSLPEPFLWSTLPLPPIPASPRSHFSPRSPPPSERREFCRVGVPGGREVSCPFFSSEEKKS